MRMVAAAAAVALTGCTVLFAPADDSSGSDGGSTTGSDGGSCRSELAPSLDWCQVPAPAGPLVIEASQIVFNTTGGSFNDPGIDAAATERVDQRDPDGGAEGPQVRVVSVTELRINAGSELKVVGALPLVFFVDGDVEIDGELNGSSSSQTGPGADYEGCAARSTREGFGLGAGAAGGSFGGDSGAGGAAGPTMGGALGTATSTPAILRGGCPGGDGVAGAVGGSGGGAVAVLATGAITVRGIVDAGGAGGEGGGVGDGGGGGGSGGIIRLAARELIVTQSGVVSAVGGGGGGGGGDLSATGSAGRTGSRIDRPTSFASGGSGGLEGDSSSGGSGGNGGRTNAEPAGDGTSANAGAGGGGGGGSEGVVVFAADTSTLDGISEPEGVSEP